MSRPATCVVDGLLWIGSALDASDKRFLDANGIRVILNCAGEAERTRLQGYEYHELGALDVLGYPVLERHAGKTRAVLASAFTRGAPVLIHCAAGINRSVALAVDFLAAISGAPAAGVVEWVRSLRAGVLTNPSFEHQLRGEHP